MAVVVPLGFGTWALALQLTVRGVGQTKSDTEGRGTVCYLLSLNRRGKTVSEALPPPPASSVNGDQIDKDLKELERKLKTIELERAEHPRWWSQLNPVVVGILAALVGFISNVVATAFQGYNAIKVEREKLQGSLIVEYIKTGDADVARQNLEFLLQTGILRDPEGKIRKHLESEQEVPVLPAVERLIGQEIEALPTNDELRQAARPVGRLSTPQGQTCTGFLVSNDLLMTTDFCATPDEAMQVTFGYQSKTTASQTFSITRVEELDEELGYAILRVEKAPGSVFGVMRYPTERGKILLGHPVSLIYHVQNKPLAASRCGIISVVGNGMHYDCATGPGASGAPVLNAAGEVVAMHRVAGGADGFKEGVLMAAIVQKSKSLKPLS